MMNQAEIISVTSIVLLVGIYVSLMILAYFIEIVPAETNSTNFLVFDLVNANSMSLQLTTRVDFNSNPGARINVFAHTPSWRVIGLTGDTLEYIEQTGIYVKKTGTYMFTSSIFIELTGGRQNQGTECVMGFEKNGENFGIMNRVNGIPSLTLGANEMSFPVTCQLEATEGDIVTFWFEHNSPDLVKLSGNSPYQSTHIDVLQVS